MTTYSVFLECGDPDVTYSISSTDTILVTVGASYGTTGNWLSLTPTGCTINFTSGSDGSTTTLTPISGASSYSVTFRTRDTNEAIWYSSTLSGTITTGTPPPPPPPSYPAAGTILSQGCVSGTYTYRVTRADGAGGSYNEDTPNSPTCGYVAPPPPPPPPTTTYTLSFYDATFASARTNFNEGELVYAFLSTTAADGTYYWSTSRGSDLVSPVDGSFSVSGGFGLASFTIAADSTTEGAETLTFYVRSGSVSGTVLSSSSITINDTSTSPAPTPTYSVANASTNEGASATVNVTTTNVANGTTLFWTVAATTADVSTTSGSFTINSNAGSFTIPAIADSLTETNPETYTISIRTGSIAGTVEASSTLTINDTSTTPAAATYAINFYDPAYNPKTTFNEGEQALVFIGTTNVPDGTTLYWSTSSGSDLVAPVNGSFVVSYGFVSTTLTIAADSLTETNPETLIFYVRSGSVSGTVLSSSSITINDTSTSPAPVDTTPNAFSFTSATGQTISSTTTSGTTTVTGMSANTSITITASNGTIDAGTSALSGTFASSKTVTTSGTGTLVLAVRVTNSAAYSTPTTGTATINGVSGTFTSTTAAAPAIDTTPDAFSFSSATGQTISSTTTSGTTTVTGMSANTSITITASNGTIDAGTSSLSGTFASSKTVTTSATGTLVLAVRVTNSAAYSTPTTGTATINGVSGTFTSTTVAAAAIDTTPDPFSFTDVGGAATNTVYTTDTVTITGLQPNYSITVTASGGTVDAGTSTLSGTFATSKTVTTDAFGSILVSARVTSSPSAGVTVDCAVTVGTLSDTFSVTTFSSGNQVNQFTFTDITNAAFSTPYTSNTITVSGLTAGLSATVTINNGTYSKNGLAYTSNPGSVTNNDTITVKTTSSPNYSTSLGAQLYIYTTTGANIMDTFTVTTPKFAYSLTPNFISIYEGSSVPLVLETIGVANGTTLFWTLDGATTADFSAVSGSFTINSSGTGTFNIMASSDILTEGTEGYTLSVRSGSTSGTVLTTSTVLVSDPPSNAYGMQIFDSNGNIVMDTNTFTVKDVKYAVSVTASISISVPSITSNTVAQVVDLSSGTDPAAVGSVSIDYINKLLIVSGGSGFLSTISLLDYR